MDNKSSVLYEDKKNTSLDSCTFAKTILMLCVVLYHSMAFWTNVWPIETPIFQSPVISRIALWLNSFHIYGFVIISGYIFCYLRLERGKYHHLNQFILLKAKRLVLPAFVVSIIWAIPFAVYFIHIDIHTIIQNYILGIAPNQLWFLWMLFWVFIISWLMFSFIEKHTVLSFGAVFLLYWAGVFASTVIPNYFQIWTSLQYIIFFWMGIKIRQLWRQQLKVSITAIGIAIQIILFCVDLFFFSKYDGIYKVVHYSCNLIVHMLGGCMAFMLLSYISNNIPWKENSLFSFLSRNSMIVFLFHQQLIYIILVTLNGVVYPPLHVVINFIFSLFISLLISFVIRKSKVMTLLVGES